MLKQITPFNITKVKILHIINKCSHGMLYYKNIIFASILSMEWNKSELIKLALLYFNFTLHFTLSHSFDNT